MSKEEMIPRIRFKQYKEYFKIIEFRDFTKLSQGLQIPINDRYLIPNENTEFYITNEFLNPNSKKSYYIESPSENVVANEEDLLMTRTGNTGLVVTNVKGAFHNNFFKIDYDRKKSDKSFLFYLLNTPKLQHEMINRAGTSTIPDLTHSDFYTIEIYIPSKIEQQKIGHLFEKLDQVISLQQQVLEATKDYKQSMLQKMFPKKGEKVPEIRFKGFNEEWEQIYLEKITDITTGKLDANAMVVDGKYDFYTSGIQKYKINDYAFEGPAITIAGNGATVGYMHIADGLFNAYQRTYVLNNFKANRSYLFYEIKNRLPQKIHEESRAGNIPYIVMDMLTKLVINIPSKEEQQKIGSFFKTLDEKIELEEKKLKTYQSMKKALMQRMFV